MFDSEALIKLHRPRAAAISNIIFIAFVMILARLWYLQVYKGKLLLDYSLKNRLRQEVVEAPRGMIFDRQNVLIVNNTPRFDAVLTPQYLKNKKETVSKLAAVLELPEKEIYATLAKKSNLARYKSVVIKKNISWKEVAIIETENDELPGVSVETFISREYADRDVGAHLLGYISEISSQQLPKYRKRDNYDYKLGDFIGQFGLEEELDTVIRGQNGIEYVEVDAKGRKKKRINADKLFEGITNTPSVPGLNILLTIDRDLQLTAYDALEGHEGALVAVDVTNGEILAMVSRPAFDPSFFSKGLSNKYWQSLISDQRNPLRDRVIQEHYMPGSTFKPFVAVAALEENAVDTNTEIFCNGKFPLGKRTFHCWQKHGHQTVDIYKSLRESCDIFYYRIGKKLDIDQVAHYAKLFGLGRKTNVPLPREVTGLIPTREWKKKIRGEEWMLGETISCVIGQSYVLSSLMQLAMAYSAIANGGKVYRPTVVKEVFSNAGKIYQKYTPEVISEVKVRPQTLQIVQEGLKQVVNHPKGTIYWKRVKGTNMSGKTGTAQVIRISADKIFGKCIEMEYKYRHHGLFVGYAPYDDPKIAVAAVVEHGCGGSTAAAPVVLKIVTSYMIKYWPQKFEENLKIEDPALYKAYKEGKYHPGGTKTPSGTVPAGAVGSGTPMSPETASPIKNQGQHPEDEGAGED